MTLAFATTSDARNHFSDLLNGAAHGLPVTVQRGRERFAVNEAEHLRRFVARTTESGLYLAREDGVWVAFLKGRPFAAEGRTADEAIDGLIEDLREYAEEWSEHYSTAPNHENEWGLVQLISLSTDEQLAAWLRGQAA